MVSLKAGPQTPIFLHSRRIIGRSSKSQICCHSKVYGTVCVNMCKLPGTMEEPFSNNHSVQEEMADA